MHDMPGHVVLAKYGQGFVQPHKMNQTLMRAQYGNADGIHRPPGSLQQTKPRGRIGPKYEAWEEVSDPDEPKELRNYADNSKTLQIP